MTAESRNGWVRLLDAGLLPLALVLLSFGLALSEPRFLSAQNLINVLRGGALLMIVACGQMIVLIVRGMDLSIGSTMALTSVTSATVMIRLAQTVGPVGAIAAGIAAGLVVGLLVGLCNGIAVAVFELTPFMVTLAMASIIGGVALTQTNGIPIYGLPDGFVTAWGRSTWLGVPPTVWAAAFVVLAVWIVQRFTVLGLRIHAVGGSPQASRVSGVNVRLHIVLAYVLCGMTASLASLLLTAQIGSGQGSVGDTLALQSIGAAVIAGVSLHGGIGRVQRVALGSLFLLLLNNAMDLLRIESKAQAIVMGVLIVAVVALDEFKKKGQGDGR